MLLELIETPFAFLIKSCKDAHAIQFTDKCQLAELNPLAESKRVRNNS